MSNWKTYSNEDAGIEFKYPPTWPDLSINHLICGNNPDCFLLDLPGSASVGWGHTSTYDNLL